MARPALTLDDQESYILGPVVSLELFPEEFIGGGYMAALMFDVDWDQILSEWS